MTSVYFWSSSRTDLQTRVRAKMTCENQKSPPPILIKPNGESEIFNPENYKGQYLVLILFNHAWDDQCSKEVKTFSEMISKFEEENCSVLGISRDGPAVLMDWIVEMKTIKFSLVSDLNMASFDIGISQRLGISLPAGYTIPSILVMDKKGTLRYIGSNLPAPGNSAAEVLRIVSALNSVVDPGNGDKITPANWQPSKPFIWNKEKEVANYYATNFHSQKEGKLTEELVGEKGENLFLEDYHAAESS